MNKQSLFILTMFAALCSPAFAAGVGKLTITIQNDRLDNTGSIKATSESSGGSAIAVAGQRVIAPVAAGKVEYKSSGSQYRNSGSIEAKAKSSGGAATAAAGQEVVL